MEYFAYPLEDDTGFLEVYFERSAKGDPHIVVDKILWQRKGESPVDVAPLFVATATEFFMFLCMEVYKASAAGEKGSLQ